MLVWVPWRIR